MEMEILPFKIQRAEWQGVISVFNVTNLKKKFLFKQERDSYSSFNRQVL